MRILHISTRLILGGSQENTVLSCEGQSLRGHDVHLAFGPIYGPEGSLLDRVKAFRTPDGRGITTHVVPNLVRQVNPLKDNRAYHELRRLMADLKPDIVHTHSSKAGILGRAAAWGSAKAVIHTIHGPPFMPVEGSPFRRAKTRLANRLYTIAERRAARRCHAIVSVADAMTREFLRRGIGTPSQYTTVYSGMETEPFLNPAPGQDRANVRAQLGLRESDFVIGTVSRLAEHKGHDDLLDGLGEELKRHPEWKLLWVGDGWWRERLVEKARAMGLGVLELDEEVSPLRGSGDGGGDSFRGLTPPATQYRPSGAETGQLILTGLVPNERIPGLVRAMDVLVHPSYREGLPRTVPQALLAGVCPIAYDCDGTPEVIRNKETGLLVPTGDKRALREAVVWAYEHPAERAAMAARGREECRVRFSAATMVDQLELVYARSLGKA